MPFRRRTLWRVLGMLVGAVVVGGCASWGTRGSLEVTSLGSEPVRLQEAFTTAVFARDERGETSFWLSNVPLEDFRSGRLTEGLVVHLDLLWRPKAGATPMDASATNASIRYTVISHGEVGIYVGAGYADVQGSLDGAQVRISVREATLELGEATEGFRDLLTPAQVVGQFSAQRDVETAGEFRRAVSQFVTNALGRTRFVGARGVPPRALARRHQ